MSFGAETSVYVFTGGAGGDTRGTWTTSLDVGQGGFNGGITGGGANDGVVAGTPVWCGGGGGGATDVRIGGTGVGNRVMVAGGGGGAYVAGHIMANRTISANGLSGGTASRSLPGTSSGGAGASGNGGMGGLSYVGSCTESGVRSGQHRGDRNVRDFVIGITLQLS